MSAARRTCSPESPPRPVSVAKPSDSTAMPFDFNTTSIEVGNIFQAHIRGKTVLITGCTKGGTAAETARVLAQYGASLILTGRNKHKVEDVIASILAQTPDARLRSLVFDLSSFDSVRQGAEEVNGWNEPIHVLINSAATLGGPFRKTVDGIEAQFATNHLGHFLFTSLIYQNIIRAGTPTEPSRIVNIASSGHKRSPIRYDDLNWSDGAEGVYKPLWAYAQSKTANILFTNGLAKTAKKERLPLLSYSVNPGWVASNIHANTSDEEWRSLGGYKDDNGIWQVPGHTRKTLAQGAASYIVAAFDPSIVNANGAYLNDAHVANEDLASYAHPSDNDDKFWRFSEELVGQRFAMV